MYLQYTKSIVVDFPKTGTEKLHISEFRQLAVGFVFGREQRNVPVLEIIVFLVSGAIWLVGCIDTPPKHALSPYLITNWRIASIIAQIVLGLVLVFFFKRKQLLFIPLFFLMETLSYTGMYFVSNLIIGIDFSNIAVKLVTDIVFSCFMMLLFMPFLTFIHASNPFRVYVEKRDVLFMPRTEKFMRVRKIIIRILIILYFSIAALVAVLYMLSLKMPWSTFFYILPYQVLFGITLSLKEELLFRWILLHGFEKITNSRMISMLLQAFIWGLYHAFFGEGTGTGFGGGLISFLAAAWFGFFAYEYRNLWKAIFGHFLLEMTGFLMLYGKFLSGH